MWRNLALTQNLLQISSRLSHVRHDVPSIPPSTRVSSFPNKAKMDDSLYDEFGNFIGEEEQLDEEELGQEDQPAGQQDGYLDDDEADHEAGQELMDVDEGPSNAVVLHEDKQYYPTAQQVYGDDVETLVHQEDAQTLAQPIIAPVKQKKFTVQEDDLPPVTFSREYMTDMTNFPEHARNVAIVGHWQHGKTAFVDMLVKQTHDLSKKMDKKVGKARDAQLRYTDTQLLERERGLSTKACPMSFLLPSTSGKSHLISVLDTPGHVNFADEVAASMRISDGVVLVVDVIEGVQVGTEAIIRHAVLEALPLVLVVNKIDRLMMDLKLPPTDAYFKIKYAIEEVNTMIENAMPGHGEKRRLSPEKGNVAFASSNMGWVFTLHSFAKMYETSFPGVKSVDFAKRLWGDIFFNPSSRKFTRKKQTSDSQRGFIHFVLEPIYKLYSHTLSQMPDDLKPLLQSLGIKLKPMQLRGNARDLLNLVCEQFFGGCEGFVDMVVDHIPSPVRGAERLLERYYTGPLDNEVAQAMKKCDQNGPLVIHTTKLFNTPDGSNFYTFGRVMSGIATPGHQVRVLGEGYSIDNEEDMVEATIDETWIAEGPYRVPISGVPAGNWVLMSGVDNSIMKTATLVEPKNVAKEDAYIFQAIRHFSESVFKVAVEPLNPSELPKMLEGLRKVNKSYPLLQTKVEESGEHVIIGAGELYMDCVMHDLRQMYAEIPIKVSDPVTRFCETCYEASAITCWATTPNQKNRIAMVAEPLDDGVATDIEKGRVSIKDPVRVVGKFFEDKYGYDLLASRNIWAFGPDDMGPNILQNDTLPSEVDAKSLRSIRESLRQGFTWATREGPLCEEPIRNTKFKILDVALADQAIARGGGQIIPTTRRACYSSLLVASPRLMEPVYGISMLGPTDSVSTLYNLLSRRRGHVLMDNPVAGTPLTRVDGLIPVIDSFGFETDMRMQTKGQATVNLVFDRWQVVPGDPLDRTVNVRKLEAASAMELARDFVTKTRRRKGLRVEVGVSRYLEGEAIAQLKGSGILDG